MVDVYMGQVMLTGFDWTNSQFARCDGALLSSSQNQALYSLLGTAYGGNGSTTFALPDLRGGTPAGAGTSQDPGWRPTPYVVGEIHGAETVSIPVAGLPIHTHAWVGSSAQGSLNDATGALHGAPNTPGSNTPEAIYGHPNDGTICLLDPTHIGQAGNGAPHPNLQPFLVMCFSIALTGLYPSQ
jgi:microcystin-dependent protein